MTPIRKAGLVFSIVALGTLPAWANNPPRPDGLFSIILIIPVVILGSKLAGLKPVQSKRPWQILLAVVLGISVVLAMAGTELALIPMVVFLVYGSVRGFHILSLAQGSRRLIGVAVIVWTLFALTDYFFSLMA